VISFFLGGGCQGSSEILLLSHFEKALRLVEEEARPTNNTILITNRCQTNYQVSRMIIKKVDLHKH